MLLWWCGGVFGGCFGGGVFVVVLLRRCFCGDVGVVVFLCFCGGVVVFLWWCRGVFVVVFLWCCFCGGVVVFLLWRCTEVLWGSVVEKCCEEVL